MTVNTYTYYLDTTDICKDIYSDICQWQRTHSHIIKAPLISVVINTTISVSNSDICQWKWYLSVIVNTYTDYPCTIDICSDKYSDIWQWTPTQIIQAPLTFVVINTVISDSEHLHRLSRHHWAQKPTSLRLYSSWRHHRSSFSSGFCSHSRKHLLIVALFSPVIGIDNWCHQVFTQKAAKGNVGA